MKYANVNNSNYSAYSSREDEIRATLSQEDVIRKIRSLNAEIDTSNPNYDIYDQLLVCESVIGLTQDDVGEVNVTESVNGSSKNEANYWLNKYRLNLISELKSSYSETSYVNIASILENIFSLWRFEKQHHWLWVSQTYTLRVINWVMSATVKEFNREGIKKTPAHYFTYCIRHRSRRRKLKDTNGVRKSNKTL